jgi:hypothetical protein
MPFHTIRIPQPEEAAALIAAGNGADLLAVIDDGHGPIYCFADTAAVAVTLGGVRQHGPIIAPALVRAVAAMAGSRLEGA